MNLINSGFLRGIGVGLIISGLIVNFSGSSSKDTKVSAQQQVMAPKGTLQTQSQPQPKVEPQVETQLETQPTNAPEEKTDAKPANSPDVIILKIPDGSGSETITSLLYDQGMINDKQAFAALSEKMKADTRFRAGKFTIPRGATDKEIIAILSGK